LYFGTAPNHHHLAVANTKGALNFNGSSLVAMDFVIWLFDLQSTIPRQNDDLKNMAGFAIWLTVARGHGLSGIEHEILQK
jgi:hypothetical protein